MNTKLVLSMLLGLILGSGITYLIIAPQSVNHNAIAHGSETDSSSSSLRTNDNSSDPFWDSEISEAEAEALDDEFNRLRKPHGYGRMNMKDGFERDICISFWYLDMTSVVENLELHTGHKFKKKLGKVYASPVEILEEQASFMKAYLAESERLADERLGEGDDKQ